VRFSHWLKLGGLAMSDTAGPAPAALEAGHSQCIEWYHEGQSCIVEANGVRVEVRFVGRKGRRARIAIIAPAGAGFQAVEPA
jgi:hypothetical protein